MKTFKDFILRQNIKLGEKLAHGSFARNVLMMFIGTALGQVASVLLSPALTRIYTPDEFGVLGIYMTTVSLLSLIVSLRYEVAIPLSKTEEEANNMIAVCFASLICFCAIISITLLFVVEIPEFARQALGLLWPYRMMIPLGLFAIGSYQIGVAYATYRQSFKALSKTKVYQGYSGPVAQIILGLLGANIWGMITGFVIGQTSGVTILFKNLIHDPKEMLQTISLAKMKSLMWKFRNFPLFSSLSVIISNLGGDGILLIVIPAFYHSTTITGFLFLINRIIGRPLIMISTSILQVYLGDASKIRDSDPETMHKRFIKLIRFQFTIVASWLLILNISAKYFVPVVFGENWTDAVPYIHIFSISYLFGLTFHPVSYTLQILEKQKRSFIFEVLRLTSIFGVLFGSYKYNLDVMTALTIYCCTQAIFSIIFFIMMYTAIQEARRKKR